MKNLVMSPSAEAQENERLRRTIVWIFKIYHERIERKKESKISI